MMQKLFKIILSVAVSLVLITNCMAQRDRKDEKPPEKPKEKIVEKPKPTPTPDRKKT